MVKLTKEQRKALKRVWLRVVDSTAPSKSEISYREFRKTVQPGPGCIMVRFSSMWLGIEPDGYTHS